MTAPQQRPNQRGNPGRVSDKITDALEVKWQALSRKPTEHRITFSTELWSHTGHKSVEKANLTAGPMTTGSCLQLREEWFTVEQAAAEPARSPGRCSDEVNDCSGSGVVQAVADAGRMRDGFLDRVVVTYDHNPVEKANLMVEPMATGIRLQLRERWLTVGQAAAEPARSPGRCSMEVNRSFWSRGCARTPPR